ncbi:MAG: XdhC family protein [Desulfobacteraceae bacterium]|jgi:xanthine dehydrogenase accessory factor
MNLIDTIITLLKQKENFAIATIINRSGSAPRDVGTHMLICKDGTIAGTIGGGILEANVQHLAKDVITNKQPVVDQFVLSAEDSAGMDMICGGDVRVMIRYINAFDSYNLKLYQSIKEKKQLRDKVWLVTPIPSKSLKAPFLISAYGEKMLAKDDIVEYSGVPNATQAEIIDYNDLELLIEPLNNNGTVYIFGAGHISQQLAPLTKMVGFYTSVIDDRSTFANSKRFPNVDELHVIAQYKNALDGLRVDGDSYLIIVTRGHSHDKTVLSQALKSSAGYIGMIGSRRKRKEIYSALMTEGFGEADFKRVFSPIGININAETPEEIALSIVAELVQQRALRR